MKIKLGTQLAILNGVVFLLILLSDLPYTSVPRAGLGLLAILFLPGYVFLLATYPRKPQLQPIERVVLSFALSIAFVSLIGLALDSLSVGIKTNSFLVMDAAVVAAISSVAWWRGRKLPPEDRCALNLTLGMFSKEERDRRGGMGLILAGLFAVILGLSLAVIIGAFRPEGRFTEFYVLGLEGRAADYPISAQAGNEVKVVLVVVNREQRPARYTVQVRIDGEEAKLGSPGATPAHLEPISLEDGEKWQELVSFVVSRAGSKRKVEFFLYVDGELHPQKPPYLWVDVKG